MYTNNSVQTSGIEDHHKFHIENVEVYRGLKPSCKVKSVDCGTVGTTRFSTNSVASSAPAKNAPATTLAPKI